MKFKSIVNYLIRAKKIIIIIYKNRNYMRNGFLQIDVKLKYVFNNNSNTKKFVKSILIDNNYKLTRKFLFYDWCKFPFFTFSSKSFHGDLCLLSNSDKKNFDVKFFDLNSNIVLTKYSKSKDLIKKITNYNLFSKFFKIPKIIEYNFNDRICIEKYIDTMPKKQWTRNDYKIIINKIFEDYIQYFNNFQLKNDYFRVEDALCEIKKYEKKLDSLCFISQKLYSLKNLDIPQVNQHGDLWLYNILFDKNKKNIYYIDWEHSNIYCFFYDIFWWIINEVVYEKNHEFLNNYLDGKFDKQFYSLFLAFDKKYNINMRKTYLYLFVAELFLKRILPKSDSIKHDADKLYYPVLKHICEFKITN
jgi:hypothetical protein